MVTWCPHPRIGFLLNSQCLVIPLLPPASQAPTLPSLQHAQILEFLH